MVVAANPSASELGEDWNYWINFVLYAVVGHMAQADEIFRRHGPAIRRVAAWLREHRPFLLEVPLYRGLMLRPREVHKGKLARSIRPGTQFTSWSEDKAVACWFAHPGSVISANVAEQRPDARGYIQADAKPEPDLVLWHHTWMETPLGGLIDFALIHPDIDVSQFSWNAATQSEVIMDVGGKRPTRKVTELAKADCDEVDELDARFTFPPFLEAYLFGS